MTLTRQKEIENITKECTSFEELNRIARLTDILIAEFSDKLSTIGIISSKVDKVYKEIMNLRYGKDK